MEDNNLETATSKKDSWFIRTFSNDTLIILTIVAYAIAVIVQEFNIEHVSLYIIDQVCTLIFLLEMIAKHMQLGFKGYWTNGQNIFDGILVIVSAPALLGKMMPLPDVSFLLVLRTLRILRLFKILRAFKDLHVIGRNFVSAMKKCSGVFISFAIIIVIIALICCSLYKDEAPEYFSDPCSSTYTIFRLFTVEGWYEIPDTIAERVPGFSASFARIFFSILLILGGVVGMSLVDAVFVDEMVSDNNDELEHKVDELNTKVASLEEKLDRILDKLDK